MGRVGEPLDLTDYDRRVLGVEHKDGLVGGAAL